MRFEKRRVLGGCEYKCDIFADKENNIMIINKVEGSYGLKDEEDIAREFIINSLKVINQSPYYSVDLYDNEKVKVEIDDAIKYLKENIDKLELARELNDIVNNVYDDEENE